MIKNKDPCSWSHKRLIVRSTLDCKVNSDLHGTIFLYDSCLCIRYIPSSGISLTRQRQPRTHDRSVPTARGAGIFRFRCRIQLEKVFR